MTDSGREIRGFALYIASIALFGEKMNINNYKLPKSFLHTPCIACYVLWMILSDSVLQSLGIEYYPNRWWGLILPWWTLGLIPFTLMTVTGLNMLATPPLESLSTITDDYAQLMTRPPHEYEGGPGLMDLPLTVVNRALMKE
ncbi:phosphatidylinositol N-acetylglucosaminyltransferase [Synchytrium microbalum]|uniref:Phosphatidylinositol N-acetylglucosaminyltransferase n=1 Tax=Synchytrium microbalum TaxID=1806994 RepID=A0A507CF58_9FUNG|nr:phosphatidylinositol N-acetylglucosaminyltransferase [Synchytrium microbalum]TPX37998.1 phosphatidylinositol N-acetylglucosaminyltransferase [Synchytrium microbalum]